MNAVISPCGHYRYTLTRTWGTGDPLVWIMLNPSTADADTDDPTIRRVIGFTKSAGYPGAVVLNLYAFRATNPADLALAPDPIGPENGHYLDTYTARTTVVCAWGAHKSARARAFDVLHKHLTIADRVCLGTTKDGAPRHPLYVPAATPLTPYPEAP